MSSSPKLWHSGGWDSPLLVMSSDTRTLVAARNNLQQFLRLIGKCLHNFFMLSCKVRRRDEEHPAVQCNVFLKNIGTRLILSGRCTPRSHLRFEPYTATSSPRHCGKFLSEVSRSQISDCVDVSENNRSLACNFQFTAPETLLWTFGLRKCHIAPGFLIGDVFSRVALGISSTVLAANDPVDVPS